MSCTEFPGSQTEQKAARNARNGWICHSQWQGLWVLLANKNYSCLITELFYRNGVKPAWPKKGTFGVTSSPPWGTGTHSGISIQASVQEMTVVHAGQEHTREHLARLQGHIPHPSWSTVSCYSSRYPRNMVIHFLHWDCGKPPGPVSWFVRRPWSYYLMADLTLLFSLQDGLCTATYFFCQGCWQPFPYYINLVYWLYLGTNIRKLNFLSQRKNKQHVDRSRSYFLG